MLTKQPPGSSSSKGTGARMAEFDLLPKITPYLDKHLLFPLLEHVQKLQVPSLAINF